MESLHSVLLSLLLRWLDSASENGNEVFISGLSKKMLKVAEVTGLDVVLPIQH